MDFVESWLNSLGLGVYAPWFQKNGINSADKLVAWDGLPRDKLEAKIAAINAEYPEGVLTHTYGHGALFRSSLAKVAQKIRLAAAEARFQLNQTVGVSEAAADDENDAFGPLKPGMVGVVVDVAFPNMRSSVVTFKVQCGDGATWWYKESSLEGVERPPTPPPNAPPLIDPESEASRMEEHAPPMTAAAATPDGAVDVRDERLSTNAIVSMAARLRAGAPSAATGQLSASSADHTAHADPARADLVEGGRDTAPSAHERRPTENEWSDLDFMLAERKKSDAAKAIQANFRGFRVRKNMAKRRDEVESAQSESTQSLNELEDLAEAEDAWVEEEMLNLKNAAETYPRLTLPQVTVQLAKLAGIRKQIASRQGAFVDRASSLTSVAGADPSLAGRLNPTTDAVMTIRRRFHDLLQYADDRKRELEEVKAARMANIRRRATPPSMPSSPLSPSAWPTSQLSLDIANVSAAPPSQLASPSTSLNLVVGGAPAPLENSPMAGTQSRVAPVGSDHVAGAMVEPKLDEPSHARTVDEGGPCAIVFKSLNDRTLHRILSMLSESVESVAEYTQFGDHRLGKIDRVSLETKPYGVASDADACVFFDIDLDGTLAEMAASRDRRTSMSAPPPQNLGYDNVSCV
mmetsp:Transcript_33094/g.86545  ORF Transcript_33094/g.86545 Transcript_33094/m.86545 type:complete len:633 (-) Transcript_33094:2253-4151(-)